MWLWLCMSIPNTPKGIKAAPLSGVNPRKHLSPSCSLHHLFFSSLSHAIPVSISPYTSIHLFVSMNALPYTVCLHFSIHSQETFLFSLFLLFFTFIFTFLAHPSLPLHSSSTAFHSLAIYSKLSTLVITLE